MYERYWGLTSAPFRAALDRAWTYETPEMEESLARLYYVIEEQRPCGAIVGPAGVGKSLLLRRIASKTRRTQRLVAVVDTSTPDTDCVAAELAVQLRMCCASEPGAPAWREVEDHLRALQFGSLPTVIFCDGFERASPQSVAAVERLLDLAHAGPRGLTVVPAYRGTDLARRRAALVEAADLIVDIQPWGPAEIAGFVRASLHRAGAQRPIFEPEAFAALHEETRGVQRQVVRLCDLSLLAAAGERRESVDAETVRRAAAELLPRRRERYGFPGIAAPAARD